MGEDGWFVTLAMYLEMLVISPIARACKTVTSRYPLALPVLVLSAVAILIADTLIEGRTNYHLLGLCLAICIIAAAAMTAKMLTPGEAPELQRADHKVDERLWTNW